jgi:O-antigen biosynthesis protein|uniref:glycosyltransferase family 2 protein n=1 Tax=Cephaloticoccus sp. TaxID=1985742 RepID=UPI00404B4BF3
MQVSFIIPLFNCLDLTQAMIASLQETLPRKLSHEIILVDDGSTDGTREWLATLNEPFRVIYNDRNLGYAASNNRGAGLAQGEALVLLNNDLLLSPGWFEPIMRARRRFKQRPAIIGNIQRNFQNGAIDHTGIFINSKGKPEHDRSGHNLFLGILFPHREVAAVTGACLLIDRALWLQLGGFDEQFSNGGEDVDLCFRARISGHKTIVSLRSIIRHHISSSPGRKLHDETNTLRLTQKWRNEIVLLGARRWCWDYLHRAWTAPHSARDHVDARQALFYALHLRATPPAVALTGMHQATDLEFNRWKQLLGPAA